MPVFLSGNPVGGGFVFLLVPPPFEYGLFHLPPELGDGKRFVTLADVTTLYAAASQTKKGFLACVRVYITKPGNRGFVTLKR